MQKSAIKYQLILLNSSTITNKSLIILVTYPFTKSDPAHIPKDLQKIELYQIRLSLALQQLAIYRRFQW